MQEIACYNKIKKGEEMNKYQEQICNLFLTDPETGEDLIVVSDLFDEGFGKYSFVVGNLDRTILWKHTILTEETELQATVGAGTNATAP